MQDEFIEKVFGPDGLIAKHHDAYEYRQGQVTMAAAIAGALQDERHLLVEAGTGTGKTLAYLTPAVAFALQKKTRVIISTGTKNLQEQLMEKDVPFLQRVLPTKFKAAYMKGRANYVCINRINKADHQPILEGVGEVDHFRTVREWSHDTITGDRAELAHLPENLSFWHRINARGDSCIGQKCADFEPCYINAMRRNAEAADIVVVNHHLFFADLNVRGNNFGRVIPDYSAVIFDEAHLIEDIAANYFGFQISNFQIEEIIRDADLLPISDAVATNKLLKLSAKVIGLAEQFWVRFKQGRSAEGRFPISGDDFDDSPLGEAHKALDDQLGLLESAIDEYSSQLPEAEAVVRRIRQTRYDLRFVVEQKDRNFVYWLERRGRGIFLQASPVDVSELLREKLFEKVSTCVLTSATLSANGGFNFIRDRLGLASEKTNTIIAESSFDYEQQAVLYLPRAMPDPRSAEFTEAAANEIAKILKVTRGQAFVLCTSNSSMKALFERVSSRIGYPCFLQGTMQKAALLETFRETPNAVLFATSSFWQGVDVRGDQLSCVIIDKLPFAVPTDPIVAARSRHIDENGGRSFFDYSVPQAVITLKQGMGRLIRSSSDRGVIAILDPRVRTKPYGREFLQSLPRMMITTDLSVVDAKINGEIAAAI
jgi:ATP-dependent DNA helicase DinG